ncbi:MAG: hypothetical protein R6U43_04900 [Candidatus Krumholzibacteriales bacterium]
MKRINTLHILITGLALRLAWLLYARPVPVSDFKGYMDLAEVLLKTGQFGVHDPTAFRLPAYPAFLAAAMVLSKSVFWLSFLNILLSTVTVYLVYRLGTSLTGRREIGIISGFLCALNPTYIFYSPLLASEHLYLPLLLLSFVLVSKSSISRTVLAGASFGAAMLTRGEALFLLPLFLVLVWMICRGSLSPAIALLAVIFVITPWCIRNYRLTDGEVLLSSTGGINFYYAHNDKEAGWRPLDETPLAGKSDIEQNRLGYELGMKYLKSAGVSGILIDIAKGTRNLFLTAPCYVTHWNSLAPSPGPEEGRTVRKLPGINYFCNLASLWYYALLALTAASIFFIRRYPVKSRVMTYGLIFLIWVLYAAVLWGDARYRYAAVTMFCILSAVSIREIVNKWKESPN